MVTIGGKEKEKMKTQQIPSSVSRLLKKQEALFDEAITRIKSSKISKFDRIQYRRALGEDIEKQMEVAKEIGQKVLGPDFQIKAIKTGFGMLRELREMGLQNYALYHQLLQPKMQEMFMAMNKRGMDLMLDIINDPDLDQYGS